MGIGKANIQFALDYYSKYPEKARKPLTQEELEDRAADMNDAAEDMKDKLDKLLTQQGSQGSVEKGGTLESGTPVAGFNNDGPPDLSERVLGDLDSIAEINKSISVIKKNVRNSYKTFS